LKTSKNAIGLLEFNSIAVGIEGADAMLKAADVEILMANPVCPGKYLALVGGDVSAVQSSVEAGRAGRERWIVDELILPNVHPSVFPAIAATSQVERIRSLGIIETFSASSGIVASDTAAKAAAVQLIEVRLSVGLGGKSFVTLTGDVSAVEAAVEAAAGGVAASGMLAAKVVIPAPRKELSERLL